MFNNKKAQQMGPLFRMWQYILFAIVSFFGLLIVFRFIFQVAFNGYILPVFIRTVQNSPIDPATQTFIISQYNNLPVYITICIFSVMCIIIVYLGLLAFREETENRQ
jgi:hypothetical protein